METKPKPLERLTCCLCDRPAYFFSHSGLLCRNDALLDAIRHEWIPGRIDERLVTGESQGHDT